MKLAKLMLIASALVLAACGTQDKKGSDKAENKPAAPQVTAAEQSTAQDEQAPLAFIVKVPVDANGNELTDQVETRSLAKEDGQADNAAQFDAGQAADVRDELDQDSSSQEWQRGRAYWNTPWYPGKLLGRGLWWGRNPYNSYGSVGNSYGGYSNTYGGYGSSSGNYGYSYSYQSTYRSNNCNYYRYSQPTYYNNGY